MAYLNARDYKTTRRSNPKLTRWQDFGAGLGIGLVVALFAYGYAHRGAIAPAPQDMPKPEARKAPASDTQAGQNPAGTPAQHYDFYSMLPNFEVVVPEKERDVKRDLPTAKIERPGTYVLQAGSYRNEADAERVATQLTRQGIQAKVQRVAVDNDVWHRVRIGPITDLDLLNKLRRQLAAADVDALVIRVGD